MTASPASTETVRTLPVETPANGAQCQRGRPFRQPTPIQIVRSSNGSSFLSGAVAACSRIDKAIGLTVDAFEVDAVDVSLTLAGLVPASGTVPPKRRADSRTGVFNVVWNFSTLSCFGVVLCHLAGTSRAVCAALALIFHFIILRKMKEYHWSFLKFILGQHGKSKSGSVLMLYNSPCEGRCTVSCDMDERSLAFGNRRSCATCSV